VGLLLICPQCHTKAPLPSRACPHCGESIWDLPREQRCYFIGEAEESGVESLEPEACSGLISPVRTSEAFPELPEGEHVSLCEILDRVLNKGVVLTGEVTISVANVDLIYLGLQVILASVETARNLRAPLWTRTGCEKAAGA
jgi:hypothetical protein